MFLLNGLPRPYNPLFYSERFSAATDDAFFLHIAATDGIFDRSRTEKFLRDAGALHVEWIEDRGDAEAETTVETDTETHEAETRETV
jgi:hypothetical protein